MATGRGSRWWWTLAVVPAMAVSACGGSQLTHDAIVAAVNGGPPPAAVQTQEQAHGPTATTPQNGVAQSPPVSSSGSAGGSGAGSAASLTGGTGAGRGAASAGGPSQAEPGARSGPTAARPAGPLAPILLGNVGTYSGPIGSSSAGTDTMIQVWAQWTNAHGGIAGHPVQVYTADDGGDPQRSLSLVKDMVENKHVIAFIANILPLTIDADLPYLHQHNIPMIGGDNATAAWTSNSVAFPVGTTVGESILGDYKIAHQRNLIKLGMFYCLESSACTYAHDFTVNGGASRAGETLVYQSQVSLTQPDFTAQCLGAQSAGAQVILLAMEANSMVRVAASCSRQNYHPIFTTISIAATNALESDPNLEGLFATAQVFPWMLTATPAAAQFEQARAQYAPTLRPSGPIGVAWASGQVLAKAAAGVGAGPTSQEILDGLWALHGETLGGLTPPLTYSRNQPSPPVSCYYLVELRGGRWTAPSGDTYAC